MRFTRRESDGELVPVDQTFVDYRQRTGEYQVQDMSRRLTQGRYYWQLPREFIGERVSAMSNLLFKSLLYKIMLWKNRWHGVSEHLFYSLYINCRLVVDLTNFFQILLRSKSLLKPKPKTYVLRIFSLVCYYYDNEICLT